MVLLSCGVSSWCGRERRRKQETSIVHREGSGGSDAERRRKRRRGEDSCSCSRVNHESSPRLIRIGSWGD